MRTDPREEPAGIPKCAFFLLDFELLVDQKIHDYLHIFPANVQCFLKNLIYVTYMLI